ncbi:MAG: three-Cys-motif partner protein TcmP [Anaerolineae bacterium]
MTQHLEAQDDGWLMRPMKNWAAEKLDYLERYLDMFTTAMRKKPWRALNYIDLFAGPGKCQDEGTGEIYLGSPLLALRTRQSFDHYFFVELDADNMQALQQRCQHSPQADRIRYFQEDCNVAVHRIAREIQRVDQHYIEGVWPCLNLAFLDPEGLVELHWDTVQALAQLRTDLVIHYSQMGLQRYMPIAIESSEETSIDRFFGSRDWREIYEQGQGKPGMYGDLIRFYKDRLCELGYVEVKIDDQIERVPMMRNMKNAPLYCLIFASKNDLGEKFWREVTRRDKDGQLWMF